MTENGIQEQIQKAKAEILSSGVTGMSSAGKSISFISLKDLQDAEDRERMRNHGPIMETVQNVPYSTKW